VRDYNPTHPLGFGTEEPHPLPPPTNSDEIPVVGSSTEAIGMKWVITFQVAITQREYTFILRSKNLANGRKTSSLRRISAVIFQSSPLHNLSLE
jgi:hypothetical protein